MKYYEFKTTNVTVGKKTPAVLYEPLTTTDLHHIGVSFHYAPAFVGEELAKRGVRALRINDLPRVGGPDPDDVFVILSEGVEYMKSLDGIEIVLSFNWSGGCTPMSAYQAIAENGCGIFQGDDRIVKLKDLRPLTPSDGIIALDSNYGNGMMTLMSLDPAVYDEHYGTLRDPELDLFNPKFGYVPGATRFDREFVARFHRGQAARMNKYIDYCIERIKLIDAGKGYYIDDEPLIIPGGAQMRANNMIFTQDVSLLGHTRREWDLVHADGSVTHEVVHTTRVPCNDATLTPSYARGARTTTVRNFLKGCAIRVDEDFGFDESSFHGVQWQSSYATTMGNVSHIHAPILSVGLTAGWEFITAEIIYDRVQSTDKTVMFIEGARHDGTPETGTEAFPGQYGDTMKNTFDQIVKWIGDGSRFKAAN